MNFFFFNKFLVKSLAKKNSQSGSVLTHYPSRRYIKYLHGWKLVESCPMTGADFR